MAEERDRSDAKTESGPGVDPAAMALALGSASRAKADAFLDDQRGLIAEQRHHLHEQFKSLRLTIWEQRMGVLLRAATAVVGIAVAGFIGAFVWNAARANGLVVESFSVPPDLAARGLSGEVVAGQLLNDLASLQDQTPATRPASTLANNWGNDIKVEIPETGVSIGELNRYVREWLGHETHITGAVYHTAGGLAVTAQIGDAHASFAGSEGEFDQTLQKTSEAIYRAAQPYLYAVYLRGALRTQEAVTAFQNLIANGDPMEIPWAETALGNLYGYQGDLEKASELAHRARVEYPDFYIAFVLFKDFETALQHDETALATAKVGRTIKRDPNVAQASWDSTQNSLNGGFALLQGDYQKALAITTNRQNSARFDKARPTDANLNQAVPLLALHEPSGAEKLRGDIGSFHDFVIESRRAGVVMGIYAEQGRWQELLQSREIIDGDLAGLSPYSQYIARNLWPLVAYALSMTGDMAGAQALIDKTPTDCSLCLRMRGKLAALEKNWTGANDWFARAAQFAPSTPFPYHDWGRALLDKGDANAAIAKFTIANQKGPHFADPLEGWGEALMAKNQSHLALEKFAEAEKYAPNWGRLHLKWGEALAYAGKKDQAKAQFTRATQLDLTDDEKSELADMAHG